MAFSVWICSTYASQDLFGFKYFENNLQFNDNEQFKKNPFQIHQ
jgi:hypothetical protein